MTEFQTLSLIADGPIGRLMLARPDVLNALNSTALNEIAAAAQWFDDHRCSVVIVSGQGRAFCAGFDLGEFSGVDAPEQNDDGGRSPVGADAGHAMATALENMEAIAIAAIRGHCIGGGLVLAGACDIRIATADAQFAIPEVDLGIPLAWGGIPRLVREIGPSATRDLVMTCRPFSADEALRLGFVNRVVEDSDLDEAVEALADQLSKKAPSVLRTTKQQVHQAAEQVASTTGSWVDATLLAAALRDPESRAAAAAYLKSR